ncbi:hypothetical protein NIES970_26980 [[Synechococcus] sp. NIES-970]|nr:hypothetical protein NIES970_26980 [[Synechococcus] sp. NIES-970]
MGILRRKISQLTLFSVLVAGGFVLSPEAIAKPNNARRGGQGFSQIERTSSPQTWQDILTDIRNEYRDIPEDRFNQLRNDDRFRNQLFSLFLGQVGDRINIRDILVDVLLGSNNRVGRNGSYIYNIDRNCLPPGQRQRLDAGNPIPPGILRKCGRPIFRNN